MSSPDDHHPTHPHSGAGCPPREVLQTAVREHQRQAMVSSGVVGAQHALAVSILLSCDPHWSTSTDVEHRPDQIVALISEAIGSFLAVLADSCPTVSQWLHTVQQNLAATDPRTSPQGQHR